MSDQEKKQTASDANAPANSGQRSDRGPRDQKGRRKHNQTNRPLDESVNMDELREIVELISEHGFTDFELENKDVRVRLRRELAPQIVSVQSNPTHAASASATEEIGGAQGATAASTTVAGGSTAPSAATAVEPPASEDENLHMITSPIVGTFFRASSPNAEPFVRLGSPVAPDAVVCIIEAMKLMNEIQADVSGEIAKIYVENGQPVEYGQPLFGIKKQF